MHCKPCGFLSLRKVRQDFFSFLMGRCVVCSPGMPMQQETPSSFHVEPLTEEQHRVDGYDLATRHLKYPF